MFSYKFTRDIHLLSFLSVVLCILGTKSFATEKHQEQEGLEASGSSEQMLKSLKRKKDVSQSSRVKKTIIPQSAHAERVIIIESNTCQRALKVFKEETRFQEESEELLGLKDIVKFVNQMHDCMPDLPILAGFTGTSQAGGKGVMMMEAAKGETLADAYLKNLKDIPDEKIKMVFLSIGKQFGTLDTLMLKETKKVLVHGDSHGGNFTYDEKTGQLYWIDLEGTQLVEDTSTIRSLEFLSNLLYEALPKQIVIVMNGLLKNKSEAIPTEDYQTIESIRFPKFEVFLTYLKYLNDEDLEIVREYFMNASQIRKKELLAIKSFADAFVEANPNAMEPYNDLIREDETNQKINRFEEALGLEVTKFPSIEVVDTPLTNH